MKPLPNWNIWKHVPTLTATEAVALTLNIEPHSIHESSRNKWAYKIGRSAYSVGSNFNDRLFLFKKCFGINGKISLNELAKWSQSVGWNIPIELAAVAPVEPKEILKTMCAETIHKALVGIVAGNVNIDELQGELIKLDVKFIVCNDLETVQIPDGTVNGKRVPISNLYSVMSELCNEPRGGKLATLVRSSGASGGGSTGNASRSESLISSSNNSRYSNHPNEIINKKPISNHETLPGKLPRTAIGKLAIKVAWKLECNSKRRATAGEVIKELQILVNDEDILVTKIPRGVTWITGKYKEKHYDISACGKTLLSWNRSREQVEARTSEQNLGGI